MSADSYKKWPLFIVVDGGDGAGKDTQIKKIAHYYYKKGFTKIRIRSHPETDNPFGFRAKRALEEGEKVGYIKAAFFYTVDVIRSLVKYYRHNKYEILIFSRYLLGVCYLPTPIIFIAYRFFSTLLPTSDYFFFLDVTPEKARERIKKREKKQEMFETLFRLRKMRKKMRLIAKKEQWLLIDGNSKPENVWYQIKLHLIKLDKL